MSFNYEQSIWGKGAASLRWSDPTSFRLVQALDVIDKAANISHEPPSSGELRVMELGCGAGQFIRAVKKYRPLTDCYGADISREALTIAQKANDGVYYSVSEENTLPYENDFFDVVLIFDVLEHVTNPGAILDEVRRVLKPGGLFYAFVPCEGDATSMWHFLDKLHLKNDLTKKYAGHINYFSRNELRGIFNKHSFEEVSIKYSEQILGQLLGVVAFHLMDRAAHKKGVEQVNNEEYFETQSGGFLSAIKKLVNSAVYVESMLLQRVPSPNVHLVVKKV